MKASVSISQIRIEANVECDTPGLAEKLKLIIEASNERIEALMADAAMNEIKRLLPGIKVVSVRSSEEEVE